MKKTRTTLDKLSDWFNNIININKLVNHFANLFVDSINNHAEVESRLTKLNRRVKFLEDVFVQEQLEQIKYALEESVNELVNSEPVKKSKKTVKKSKKSKK